MLLNAINYVLTKFGYVLLTWQPAQGAILTTYLAKRFQDEFAKDRAAIQADVCEFFTPPEKPAPKLLELSDNIADFNIDVPLDKFVCIPYVTQEESHAAYVIPNHGQIPEEHIISPKADEHVAVNPPCDLTKLYVSPEAMKDIASWTITEGNGVQAK